ncbi:hypothetical protein LDENG_00220560 [Lucifuga dentata]|nr:hypothetical protein LDENG_00220560 [Lucifuga dentata]
MEKEVSDHSRNISDLEEAAMTSLFNKSFITNQTIDSSPCGQMDTPAHLCFMLICSLMFLVGLILNGFTMKVYFCQTRQRVSSSVTVYLKNLAAADFLLCLSLPLRIANYAKNSVTVHQIYCQFGAPALYLNMYASILFIGYIATNRYLKIVRPFENHILQTVRVACFVSAVTWIFILAMTAPPAGCCWHSRSSQHLPAPRRLCSWSQVFFYMKEVTIMVSILNICLDPLIYFIFCKAFRAQLYPSKAVSNTQAGRHPTA